MTNVTARPFFVLTLTTGSAAFVEAPSSSVLWAIIAQEGDLRDVDGARVPPDLVRSVRPAAPGERGAGASWRVRADGRAQ